jgi:uncharacterized protein (DUF1800 family)
MQKLKHLLWRFGFGPRTLSWEKWAALPPESWWPKMKDDTAQDPEYFDVANTALKGLLLGVGELGKMERKDLDKDEKKRVRQESREGLKSLNLLWLEEMTHSKAQLREKMAFFWHGHFASRNINILYQQQLLHVIRQHALGNFGDLLREVSKTAAILAFLNNQQNKKQHPNENFAREVMELFTLGRGHYTETDIKEAARAFTGWGFRLNGDFQFRRAQHDSDTKTIFGKTGQFDGDDVLNMLLERRETAHFIARKAYRFFVNENDVPVERIAWLGDRFYDADYSIMRLLEDIARSDWFYEPQNMGCNIKSPVELWVGLRRALPMELHDTGSQLMLQRALGQVLFYPPNVAGWPGGRQWIDSSSLTLRLRLPNLVVDQGDLDINTKDDDDQQMGERSGTRQRRLGANIDWSALGQQWAKTPDAQLLEQMAQYFWQTPARPATLQALQKQLETMPREQRIRSSVVQLMSLPEYQML